MTDRDREIMIEIDYLMDKKRFTFVEIMTAISARILYTAKRMPKGSTLKGSFIAASTLVTQAVKELEKFSLR